MANTYSLLQLTDCHLPASVDQNYYDICPDQQLADICRAIRKETTVSDLLLLTGDLVHHSGNSASYQRLLSACEGLAKERAWIPGNHDPAELMADFAQLRTGVTELGNWLIILLDTTSQPDGKGSGSISEIELQRLQGLLESSSDKHVLLVMHHNPVALGAPWQNQIMLQNAAAFWQVVEVYSQIRGVIFGHLHQSHQLEHRGMPLYCSPSTSIQYRSDTLEPEVEREDEKALPGFRHYLLHPDGSIESGVKRIAPGGLLR